MAASSFQLLSEQDNFMYYYDENRDKVFINNQTSIEGGRRIYINYYLNISQKTNVIVKKNINSTFYNYYNTHPKKSKKLATWKIVLIVIGILLGIIIILLILKMLWNGQNNTGMKNVIKTESGIDINQANLSDLKNIKN